jgi:hypothetical protein
MEEARASGFDLLSAQLLEGETQKRRCGFSIGNSVLFVICYVICYLLGICYLLVLLVLLVLFVKLGKHSPIPVIPSLSRIPK